MKSRRSCAILALVGLTCLGLWVRASGESPLPSAGGPSGGGPSPGSSRPPPDTRTAAPSANPAPAPGAAIKTGHKTWRYSDTGGIAEAARQAAIEAFSGKDVGIRLDDAVPEEPLRVEDECRGNRFFLVPLTLDDQFGGVVLMKAVGTDEVRRSVVRPGPAAQLGAPSPQPSLSQSEYEQAYLTEPQAAELAARDGHTPSGPAVLTIACAGEYPLAPPTAPYFAFPMQGGRVLVSSVTGDVVTERELDAFRAANDRMVAAMGPTEIVE